MKMVVYVNSSYELGGRGNLRFLLSCQKLPFLNSVVRCWVPVHMTERLIISIFAHHGISDDNTVKDSSS